MTTYDDDADRMFEECEYCGKLNIDCTCPVDPEVCPVCDEPFFVKHCQGCGHSSKD